MAKVGTQDIELDTFSDEEREAFWGRRVQQYRQSERTREAREVPPVLAPTDEFTATIINAGSSYSLKSIREGQGYAGPNNYRMQDLQTGRPVRLSDFVSPGATVRYEGKFYFDRYADLVNQSAAPVLWDKPNHTWDKNDNTHVGGTGTGDGGAAGNNSRWRACVFANHFLYTNFFLEGKTNVSDGTDLRTLKYYHKVKHYSNVGHTGARFARLIFADGQSRGDYTSQGTGIGTNFRERAYDVIINGSPVHPGNGIYWWSSSSNSSNIVREVKEHILMGCQGTFAPSTAPQNSRSSYISQTHIEVDFTVTF